MKVLVGACVWSLSLRRKDPAALNGEEQRMVALLVDAIQDGRVAMVGPIRQEVLSGIREIAQFERLRRALEAFPDTPMATPHYEEAARLFNLCRSRGVECGAVDILLCAVASRERWSLLTTDGGLKRCIETLRAEGVYR
ncbi:MAG TPA: PIN domain-containing protein [Terracidiphilus sp.]